MKTDEIVTKRDVQEMKEELLKEFTLLKDIVQRTTSQKEWLTTRELKEQFSIKSDNTVLILKSKGLRCLKMGSKNLFNYYDVIEYMKKNNK